MPPLVRHLLLFLFLWLNCAAHLQAEIYLRDDAGLYARNPVRKEQFESMLQQFQQQYQVPFYVVIQTSTSYSGMIQEQSSSLRSQLIPVDKDGFLLFYDADSGLFAMSIRPPEVDSSPGKWEQHLVPLHLEIKLNQTWQKEITANIAADQLYAKQASYAPEEACFVAASAWISAVAQNTKQSDAKSSNWVPVLLVFFLVAGGFLLLLMMMKRFSKKRQLDNVRFEFPRVNAKARLGASRSGGSLISRNYRE